MRKREAGSALILVLVVLGILGVAMAGVVRSTGTTVRVAGNAAFKQAATQASELSLSAAETYVNGISAPGTDVANRYFSTMQTTDAAELPTTVNWANVATTTAGNYNVQWVVERMCTVAAVTDAASQCMTLVASQAGSQRAHSPSYNGAPAYYYRITARVTGPRDTETFVQSAVSR